MDSSSLVLLITFPSFMAIAIKIWLVVNSNKRTLLIKHWPLMLIFFGTGGTNLVEFLSFSQLITPGLISLKLYYLSLILSFLGLLCFSLKNTVDLERLAKPCIKTAGVFTVVLTLLIFSTDLIIAGYQMIDYSITRVAGTYYWLFQVFALFILVISIALNVYGALAKGSENRKCKATLVCFLPYALSIIGVIILMQSGVQINASLIVPLSTTYLLLVLIYLEEKNLVFKILARVPFSTERKCYSLLSTEVEKFLEHAISGEKTSLKEFTNAFERKIVLLAVEMSDGNQAKAASLLNTSSSSVCRRVNS